MKKVLLSIFLLCFSTMVFAQDQFTLTGKITGAGNAYARLSYINAEKKHVTDSCALQNETFTFKGTVNGVSLSTLIIYQPPFQTKFTRDIYKPNTATIYIEAGNIIAEGTFNKLDELKVKGSKSHNEYSEISSRLNIVVKEFEPISTRINNLKAEITNAKKQNKSQQIIDSLNSKLVTTEKLRDPFAGKYEAIIRQFVFSHPNSLVTPIQMGIYVSSWPIDSVRLIYNSFSPTVKKTFAGQSVKKQIDDILAHSANTPAVNFTAKSLNGKNLSLNDFKGKYILLDFWGSWCIPCRESTPHLIALHKKYNKSGLEIIGIDADDTETSWKRAIKMDKTNIFHNVFTTRSITKEGTKGINKIVDSYAVSVFPTKILIDKNGMVIGRYVGTEDTAELDKKLAELFDNKN